MAEITTRKLSASGDFTGTINGVAPVLTEPGLSAALQGHLTSSSAHATTTAITYYVNVSTGSDTNDGLASGTAFKTITKAINLLPRFIDHSVTINVAAGDYSSEGTIVISGFSGKNFISVLGDTTASTSYSFSRVNVLRCATNIYIRGFNCTSTAAQHFTCSYCKYVILEACNSTASASVNGFHISSGTAAYIKNCVSSNKGAAIYCENSNIYSENNSGTGNSIGLYCVQSGKIGKKGTQPGGTAAETIDGGGQIV